MIYKDMGGGGDTHLISVKTLVFWFFGVSSKVSLAFLASSFVFLVFLSFLDDFH